MRIARSTALLLAGMSAWSAQAAPDAASLRIAALAANCFNCHGTQGQAVDRSLVPGLAGVPRDSFIAKMAEFRDGKRPATVMHQIAKGFNEAQIAQLADYFAAPAR
ncbi:MAG: cytochrome C [Burkholderiales bacterium]|nr:cytochrome C [Burkholderiales bacterium]